MAAIPQLAEAATRAVTRTGIHLTDEQLRICNKASAGESLLILGAAGTGKSFTIRAIESRLRMERQQVITCAPFGVAACNVNGFTVHSTFGLKVQDMAAWVMHPDGREKDKMRDKMLRASARSRRKLWESVGTFIIDEISTLDAATYELIDYFARRIRGSEEPCGGLQVLAVGDFLQLPPVKGKWVFQSEQFLKHFDGDRCMRLLEVMRQDDEKYLQALNTLRTVNSRPQLQLAKDMIERSCFVRKEGQELSPKDRKRQVQAEQAVRLVPLRRMADTWNHQRLQKLPNTGERRFSSIDTPVYFDKELAALAPAEAVRPDVETALGEMLAHSRLSPEVAVRVGARVMMLHNTTIHAAAKSSKSAVVNGHTGVVVGFMPLEEAVRSRGGGGSEDSAASDPLSNCGEAIHNWASKNMNCNGATVPLVQWDHMTHAPPRPVLPVEQQVGNPVETGGYCRSRTQIPLSLAWAITTHKCQGMTLPGAVSIDLHNSWERGQAYVALSRTKAGGKTAVYGLESATDSLTANTDALNFCVARGLA
eukprot:Hpha_TRINITY_DN15202_c0_g6::TRINITY_DN15202_c0_g6_i1::g.66972::m.66972/K15255/PIF1; ATP-dependent DNA helicase PIF1